MNCEEARELLDAHSLGALEKSESRRVQKHLARCAGCRLLHDEAVETTALLALAAPLRRASPALRLRLRRVMVPRPRLGWFPTPRLSWATAAAALAIVSLGGISWGGFLQTQVNGLKTDNNRFDVLYSELGRRDETVNVLQKALTDAAFKQQSLQDLLQQQDQAMRVVALDSQGREDLSARCRPARSEVPTSGAMRRTWAFSSWLTCRRLSGGSHLPALGAEPGRHAGKRRHIRPQSDGSARLLVQGELGGTLTGMAITVEPAGGSQTPTGEIILQGRR